MHSAQRHILASLFFIASCPLIFAAQPAEAAAKLQALETLSSVPLAFESNVGQSGPETRFIVHRPDLSAGFASDAVTLLLPRKGAAPAHLGISFGRSAQIVAEHELPGKTNYFRGNNPAAWHTGIANFGRIRYSRLWPGTDVVFYGTGRQLEHDFIVAPGADPQRISLELKGADSIASTPEGDLVVKVSDTFITFKKPIAYQETSSGRVKVAARFKVHGNKVGFTVGRYDHQRELTIDPVVIFSTLLVGSVFDGISAMALDASGNIYVTGDTGSPDFPTTPTSAFPACDACNGLFEDAFVTKLNPTGTALVYSTFIGGSDFDTPHSIVVDSNGNATIAGNTFSADFPAVNPIGTFTNNNNWHMFVASLSPTGAALNYSGIVGPLNLAPGNANIIPSSTHVPLAVDASGNVYAAVQTIYSSFPTTTGTLAPVPPNPQAAALVAMKIGTTGSLVYSTAIPGSAAPGPPGNFGAPGPNTFFQFNIAVDSGGNSYISGQADDGLPTTLGVIGPSFASVTSGFGSSPQEGFLLKLNPTGSALIYATYIPGTARVLGMRLDSSGNIYLGGDTPSALLPVSATGFQQDPGCSGCQALFLLKLNNLGTSVLAGTYLRGAPRNLTDQVTFGAIALDPGGNVFVTGTDSEAQNLPMKNALEQLRGSYLVELSSDLSTLLLSSGAPPAVVEAPTAGKLVVASNAGYPPTPGAFQTTVPAARGDLFVLPNVAAIDLTVAAPVLCRAVFGLSFPLTTPGTTSAPQSATISNCGNADLHISSITSNSPDFNVTTNCPLAPTGVAPGNSCTVTATYSPVDFNSGDVVITDDALRSPHEISLSGAVNGPRVFFEQCPFFASCLLTFLETPVTTTEGLSLSIGNNGTTNLTITGLSTTGDYSVSQNCVGQVIPPPTPSPFGPILHFCDAVVSFSPTNTGTRLGTVIVKDSALDSPQIVQLTGTGLAAWPTPSVSNDLSVDVSGAGANVNQSTGNPETLAVTGSGFSRVTTVTLDGILFDNNVRQMTIVNSQQINLNLFDTDFGDTGEVPVAAITPAPGGGTSSTVATITSPIKFYDPTDRTNKFMPSGTVAVGPKSGLIYDSFFTPSFVSFTSPNIPVPSVGVLDPDKEILVSGLISFPDQSTAIALSDDETFMYAALPNTNTVAQVALPGGAINFRAALGKDPALGNYNAAFIAVMPGHPHTWVASLQPTGDTKPIALKVFDDGVARANTVEQGNASAIFPGKLLFVGADTSTVYSIDSTSLYRFTIDANGVTLKDKTAGLGAEDFATDGSLIYLSTGAIIDPATLATKGTFALAPGLPMHAVAVDAATHRAIFAGDASAPQGLASLVQAFDTATLAAKGLFIMPRQSFVSSMYRWGTNGLAFTGSELTITRSSLTGTSGAVAPFHIGANFSQAPIPSAQISAGSTAVFNLGIVSTNGFNGPVALSCSNLPQFASCSFSQNPVTPASINNLQSGSFTVTVNTHQAATASMVAPHSIMRSGSGFILLTAVLSLPFALAMASRRYRGKLLALCLLIAMVGCGGGGGSTGGPTPTPPITPTPTPSGQNTPIGVYDIILTGTSSQGKRQVVLQVIVLG